MGEPHAEQVQAVRPHDPQSLAARKRSFLVWDTYQRGLAVRVQPGGEKSYTCIYRHHGRLRWYHIGHTDAFKLKDARKLASRLMAQVAEGIDPAAERKVQRANGTFEELAARYVAEYAKKKNKSWEHAEKLVAKHLLPKWAKLKQTPLPAATSKPFSRCRSHRPTLANSVKAAASAIFSGHG